MDQVFVSWAAEVVADSSGKFCGNGLRFATQLEAETYAIDLASRWTLVRDWRVVQSIVPVNSQWVNGRCQPVGPLPSKAR